MNFSPMDLDDDIMEFWSDVRTFFDVHVDDRVHDEERLTGGGFNEPLHLQMGKRGWVAPEWPVEEGGAGLDSFRARIIALEKERSGAPYVVAGTTMLPPVALRLFANEDLKREVLPGVADGSIRICLGYTEPDCGSDLAAVRTRAVRDGDEWVVSGQKMFTTGAQHCKYCFCLTRTNTDVAKHKGLSVFLIPLDLPGVEIRRIDTLGGERTNFVHFDDVLVPDHYRIGAVDEGWSVIAAPLAHEHGMDRDDEASVGATYGRTARQALDAVVDWLAAQPTSDGGSMLDDPAIREKLAEMVLHVEIGDVTQGPYGRVLSAEYLLEDAPKLLDIIGAQGLLAHGADGAVGDGIAEYAFRFAPGTRIYGGSTDIHRNLIAERILGLPRSSPR